MTVYANGLEVSCKVQANKVIAAFPDVCFTPPENPATPPGIPVPYPTFGFDDDTDKGTGSVKIGDKTISQKNKSHYTKTTGTEAGCAAKKGVINSKNTGKKYCRAWSPNVKAEKLAISRFSDITTNNHASSDPPNAPTPTPEIGGGGAGSGATVDCPPIDPFDQIDCPDGSDRHHIVPDMVYRLTPRRLPVAQQVRAPAAPTLNEGMCICLVRDTQHQGLHANVNQRIAALGANGNPVGTAPIGALADIAIAGLWQCQPPLDPECIDIAADRVAAQIENCASHPGRTVVRPPPQPGSAAHNAITNPPAGR
jgi:hypothetical protein